MPSMSDVIAVRSEHGHAGLDRDEAIKAIRAALKRRSGKVWSVTGGRGTAWGWITIDAPKRRRTGKIVRTGDAFELVDTGEPQEFGYMTPQDRDELAALLGMEPAAVHHQGLSIPAGTDYRVEYVNRAEGRAPSTFGTPYWD